MTKISKVRNKWVFIVMVWAGVFIIGWIPVVMPSFSTHVFNGLIVFCVIFSVFISFFWPRLEWHILLIYSQILPIELLLFSSRTTIFLPSLWANIANATFLFFYIGMFFLPKFAPRISYLMVYGNPESKLEKQIYGIVLGVLGIAGACGASIGIFGGRLYGWKILGPIGLVIGLLAIFLGHLTFYNLWQKRPWLLSEKGRKA